MDEEDEGGGEEGEGEGEDDGERKSCMSNGQKHEKHSQEMKERTNESRNSGSIDLTIVERGLT